MYSVDRTSVAYDQLKSTLYDGRVEIPNHQKLHTELRTLERNTTTGKIDHPPQGSKDISDALAGVVSQISRRREVWADLGESIRMIPASLEVGKPESPPETQPLVAAAV